MALSKPQEHCQELQLAAGHAKLPGCYEMRRLLIGNRDEVVKLLGTEAPTPERMKQSAEGHQKS
jgi:hypothetical protein